MESIFRNEVDFCKMLKIVVTFSHSLYLVNTGGGWVRGDGQNGYLSQLIYKHTLPRHKVNFRVTRTGKNTCSWFWKQLPKEIKMQIMYLKIKMYLMYQV